MCFIRCIFVRCSWIQMSKSLVSSHFNDIEIFIFYILQFKRMDDALCVVYCVSIHWFKFETMQRKWRNRLSTKPLFLFSFVYFLFWLKKFRLIIVGTLDHFMIFETFSPTLTDISPGPSVPFQWFRIPNNKLQSKIESFEFIIICILTILNID